MGSEEAAGRQDDCRLLPGNTGGTTTNGGYRKNDHFPLEHVEIKEPRGLQVETQTTQKNDCSAGRYNTSFCRSRRYLHIINMEVIPEAMEIRSMWREKKRTILAF